MLKKTSVDKCSRCQGSKCCQYITQRIPGPRSKEDFDHLLWQLAHENVQAYKDSDGWFLLINNRCRFLRPDGRCGIYEHRPRLCRDYSNDYCEYDSPAEEGFELHFRNYEELLAYCRKRFKRWDED
ncbi:MAG TPA: YkgJ family cysteine cluster protein [Thiotrichales bacterium]|nr:YkgJ family cysteine cluster protein [Thiotrichales bacterium]